MHYTPNNDGLRAACRLRNSQALNLQYRATIKAQPVTPVRDAGIMRTITLVLLSILIAACAARHRAAPTPGASLSSTTPPTGAVVASAPAGTTPTPAAPVADQPTDPNVPDPNILKRGYRAFRQNGQLLYCRSQILTGTHFPSTVCLTDAQVKASEHGKQEALDQISKSGGVDCRVYKCN